MPFRTPSSTDQLIGMQIRERRMVLGLTLLQFGELIGVAYQQVYKYEHGINRISAGRLYEIALGAGTPVEYFFEDLEPNECKPPPRQSTLLDVMCSLVEIQDERHQAAVLHLVRSLAG